MISTNFFPKEPVPPVTRMLLLFKAWPPDDSYSKHDRSSTRSSTIVNLNSGQPARSMSLVIGTIAYRTGLNMGRNQCVRPASSHYELATKDRKQRQHPHLRRSPGRVRPGC